MDKSKSPAVVSSWFPADLPDSNGSEMSKKNNSPRVNLYLAYKNKMDRERERHRLEILDKVSKEFDAHPPLTEQLIEVNRRMYVQQALDAVVLNYKMFYQPKFNEDERVWDVLFHTPSNLNKYLTAVDRLMEGEVGETKTMLLDLVHKAVQPAYFAYALVILREIINDCDVLNLHKKNLKVIQKNKSFIEDAVRVLERADLMEPASSFVIGMMKRFNIGECSQFMSGSWQEDLIQVVNVAICHGVCEIDLEDLNLIDFRNKRHLKKCGVGMERKIDKFLREMCQYSLYEFALNISESFCQISLSDKSNNLFLSLANDGFLEASYSYAVALLQVHQKKHVPEEDVKVAMEFLCHLISAGHKGAKFLLGILPFISKVGYKITYEERQFCIRHLENYISLSHDMCDIDERNVDTAAYCLAVHYYTKESYVVSYDRQKAEHILKSRNLLDKLAYLQYRAGEQLDESEGKVCKVPQ